MAPRKKNASIKTSGAMSSKAAPLPDWVKGGGPKPTPTHAKADGTPQLFPKGVKTPLNLLYERLQKIPGWEKPDVEPRQHKQGFSCVITLRKENKQDRSNPHTVVFEPREPGARLTCASSLEAKHWGATYALFRLFNHLSLQKMLPAGPREYWIQLEGVKAQSSPDDEWKWAADPFDAVQKRDAAAAAREKERAERAARRDDPAARPLSRAWQRALDVKMAPALRELVEATVRTHMAALLPAGGGAGSGGADDGDDAAGDVVEVDTSALERELHELGLRPGYVRKVVSWLVHAREKYADARAMSELRRTHPLLATVLALSNREAAIEYSVLYLPEQDLPPRLRPTAASESFVTSGARGGDQEGLVDRWTTDKFVRGAGFPAPTVQQVLERVRASVPDASIAEREAIALDVLLHRLVGEDVAPVRPPATDTTRFAEERESLACTDAVADVPEREAIGADFSVHIGTHARDAVDLRVAVPPVSAYLQGGWPLIYVTSPTLPAFLRLALTQHAVQCLRGEHGRQDIRDALEVGGALFLVADELRDKLAGMLEDPPDLDVVMEHLVEKKEVARVAPAPQVQAAPAPSAKARRAAPQRRSAELDAALRARLDAMHASAAYREIAAQRESLPAHGARADLLAALRASRVVVVAGETGCGKTTQVPQFILDDAIARGCGSGVSIVVTQPRRVSAMGVAARVAQERCESLDAQDADAQVGYAIRGERRAARGCRILFSTTGVLLRRLAAGGDPTLRSVSHVVVDEVHERSTDSDLLLLLLRDVLAANPELRVVLMSATIKAETFTAYFGGAPYFCIPGRTFPVHSIYLEELVAATQFRCAWHARVGEKEAALVDESGQPDDGAVQTLRQLATGRADYELVARAVGYALGLGGDGAVLVFCPGVGEIRQAMQAVAALGRGDVLLLPLHANLPAPEQRRVFERAPPGMRKVVVATNVAETSITIPEVCFVVDTGRVREARYDVQLSVHRLVETWASRAACRQRAGRAGRTRPGTCIRLYSRGMEERLMPAETTPEMQRAPLESVVMQVKAVSREDVRAVLGRALSPPPLAAVEATTERLVVAGALHAGGFDARLTPLGRYLADMPIDLRLAKLLVLGALCGCLEPLLHVAALLSSRPIVAAGMQRDEGAAAARRAYVRANSDLLTSAALVAAYLARRHRREKTREVRAWCDGLGLSAAALQDVEATRAQLARSLEDLGLVDSAYVGAWRAGGPAWPEARAGRHAADRHSGNTNLLRALLVAALWPGVARVDAPGERYAASATGAVLKEADARELHYFDERDGRVFVHPGSALFSATQFKSNYVSVFAKSASGASGKTYIREVSEAPLYGLLLFGGPLHVEHDIGGIAVSTGTAPSADAWIKLRASPRIGVLCRQLRTLLDGVLEGGIADPRTLRDAASEGVVAAIAAVLVRDGAD